MLSEHVFARDEVLPSWWANAVDLFLSTRASGFTITHDATHVTVAAGADDQAAVVSVGGAWRWIEAPLTRAHPGGGAGTYLIFVTAAATDIVGTPAPYTDDTNYAFSLAITATGDTPTIVAGVVDLFRQVATCDWDGAQITRVDQSVPATATHAGTHATAGADPLAPTDIGAAAAADLIAETDAREAADIAETDAREAADTAEAIARAAADTTESTARTLADTTETTARTNADVAEATARANADTALGTALGVETVAREAADTTETAAREAADTAEAAARAAGDVEQTVHVANWSSTSTPPDPAGTIVGVVPVPVLAGQAMTLVGVMVWCYAQQVTPSKFTVQTDHGSGPGALTNVGGLVNVTPAPGREAEVDATGGPVALARGDKVAIVVATQGDSLGCSIALLFGRSV